MDFIVPCAGHQWYDMIDGSGRNKNTTARGPTLLQDLTLPHLEVHSFTTTSRSV